MKRRQFIKALFTGAATVAAAPLLKLLPKEEPKELWRSVVHPFMANGLIASDTGSLTYDMLHNAIERCKDISPFMPEVIYLPPAMYNMLQEVTKEDLKQMYPEYKPEMCVQVRQGDYLDKPTRMLDGNYIINLNKRSGADFFI